MPELIADLPAVAILLPAASVYFLWALFHWVFSGEEDYSETGEITERTTEEQRGSSKSLECPEALNLPARQTHTLSPPLTVNASFRSTAKQPNQNDLSTKRVDHSASNPQYQLQTDTADSAKLASDFNGDISTSNPEATSSQVSDDAILSENDTFGENSIAKIHRTDNIDTTSFHRLFPRLNSTDSDVGGPSKNHNDAIKTGQDTVGGIVHPQRQADPEDGNSKSDKALTQDYADPVDRSHDDSLPANTLPVTDPRAEHNTKLPSVTAPIAVVTKNANTEQCAETGFEAPVGSNVSKDPIRHPSHLAQGRITSDANNTQDQTVDATLIEQSLQPEDSTDGIEQPESEKNTPQPTHVRPGQKKSAATSSTTPVSPAPSVPPSPIKYRTAARRKPLSPVEEVQLQLKADTTGWKTATPTTDQQSLKLAHEMEISARDDEISQLKKQLKSFADNQPNTDWPQPASQQSSADVTLLETTLAELENSNRKITRLQSAVNKLQAASTTDNTIQSNIADHSSKRAPLLSKVRVVSNTETQPSL